MLYGNIIFSGEVCAVLKEYNREHSECESHILFVHALTTDVAFYVLSNSVCGVISEESSFATHGANILRCHYNDSKNEIPWVSGIKRSDLADLFGEKVFITLEGKVCAFNNTECTNFKRQKNNEQKIASYVPLSKRSILNYNISDNSYTICYWPHRQFNALTFSIMKEGLSKNLCLYGMTDPFIFMDINGNIWFKNAPLISELSEVAKNCESGLPMLLKQINMYSDIHARLQGSFGFSDLIEMLINYFSIFILFHDTYEDVLVAADSFFKMHLEQSITYQIMNLLMCCKLDGWMLNNNIVLEKRKNLLSGEKIVPLPDFSITSDIDYCIMRFSDFFISLGLEEFLITHKKKIEFYIKFFVAKEWKFVMNKILFTRFSDNIRKQLPNISFTELALKNIIEIKNLVKEIER